MIIKLKCEEHIWDSSYYYKYNQCKYNATTEYEGKSYCRLHNPEFIRLRKDEKTKKLHEERIAFEKRYTKDNFKLETWEELFSIVEMVASCTLLDGQPARDLIRKINTKLSEITSQSEALK